MTTFDEILPRLRQVLLSFEKDLDSFLPLLINRDLNGRIRLVVDERCRDNKKLSELVREIVSTLGQHTFPRERLVLFEPEIERFLKNERTFPLSDDFDGVFVVDRLATEGDWGDIATPRTEQQRIVFFSMKGGVGRSTALATVAWVLAETGLRVMVLDLDLESPGLSSSLLPEDRRPKFGIVDWLVEDLVDNGKVVFDDMVATSELSRNGEILVVPAHGRDPGEYVSKLGRIWMPRLDEEGNREPWPTRLNRLLENLENKWSPDVVLLDSRAGIDEVASTCLTDLGASLILLFAIDGDQTWSGYRILFRFWRKLGVVRDVRERLQMVGAMVPETGARDYLEGMREHAWNLFSEEMYDEVPPGELTQDLWSFDVADDAGPHTPWRINWHRGFTAPWSLHDRLYDIDTTVVTLVFGDLIAGVTEATMGDSG